MRGLEWCVLGEDDHDGQIEVIVNVTEVEEISEVMMKMAQLWTWESFQIRTQSAFDDELPEEEATTEWLVLIGAKRRAWARATEPVVQEMVA